MATVTFSAGVYILGASNLASRLQPIHPRTLLRTFSECFSKVRRNALWELFKRTSEFLSIEKADSTLRASRAVPHPSTNRALRRLTSEVRRDPVHSTRYGRQRNMLSRFKPRLLYWHRRSERKVLFASQAFVAHVGRSTHSIMAT